MTLEYREIRGQNIRSLFYRLCSHCNLAKMLTISRKSHHPVETLSIELKRWSRVFQEFVIIKEVIFGVLVIS